MSENIIRLSQRESRLFELKMGRASVPEIDPRSLLTALFRERYDVLRLHLPSSDPDLELKLNQLGLPFFLNGIVQQFSIDVSKYHFKPLFDEGLVFESYSSVRRLELSSSIERCFSDEANGFFEIPFFRKKAPAQKQIRALIEFFLEELETNSSGYLAWSVLKESAFVGFIINKVEGTRGETLLAGVDPRFRNQGVFTDIVRFIQNISKQLGLTVGFAGARIQNQVSQRLFVKEGMTAERSFMIYYILPFFGLQEQMVDTGGECSRIAGGEQFFTIQNWIDYLDRKYPNRIVKSIRHQQFGVALPRFVSFQLIEESSSDLVIAGAFDSEFRICGSAWIVLQKKTS